MFNQQGRSVARSQQELPQIFPSPGHVEHDPEAIWKSQLATARAVLKKAKTTGKQLVAIGITNQRETVVLWERKTGRPIDNAIVWQSRITAQLCEHFKKQGLEKTIRRKTGLMLDPYFSGTKIRYLLDEHKLNSRARRGDILQEQLILFSFGV